MRIIEKESDLELLSDKVINLVFPIWSSHKAHEFNSDISFIYLRTDDGEFIVNINHIDADKLGSIPKLKITNDTLVYGIRYLPFDKGIDFEYAYLENNSSAFSFKEYFNDVYLNYDRNTDIPLNDCIPMMKWYEYLNKLSDIPYSNTEYWYLRYSNSIKLLGEIESHGIKVDTDGFVERFNFDKNQIKNGFVYSKYNPYTVTGRPSNHHLSVNWASLNKSDGTRKLLISRFQNGKLLSFDFESYHLRIIGSLVGYKFPKDKPAHQHLADIYGVDYEESKAITFKYLYGEIDEEAKNIEFFKLVYEYRSQLYKDFVINGNITTKLFGRIIPFKSITEPSEQKTFNYLLQSLETEINYLKLAYIIPILRDWKSKLILYSYDAFLFDVHPDELNELIDRVEEILIDGGFPIRIYVGDNYDDLTLLN